MILGARIEILERKPFGGPLVVRVGEPPTAPPTSWGTRSATALSISVQH